jgi:hypothetical protein
MNLQQVLHYRDNCILCQRPLTYFVPEYPKLNFWEDVNGFHLRSGHKSGIAMDFNFDGTYRRNKRHYKIYSQVLKIIKGCQECQNLSEKLNQPMIDSTWLSSIRTNIVMKSRSPVSFSHTSLNNLKSKECAYTFQLEGTAKDYSVNLNYDKVRYCDKDQFFHIDTYYHTGTSILHHARFDQTVDNIFALRIPSTVSLTNVKTVEQYVNKCKMLMLFS